MNHIETMKQALDALEHVQWKNWRTDKAIEALRAAIAQDESEPVAECRGYALLGTGNYVINHSADFDEKLGAELIITLATDEDRSGNRQIGESRPTAEPGNPIEAYEMVIRIGFLNERGLFALEDQLSEIRKAHFGAAPQVADYVPLSDEQIDDITKKTWPHVFEMVMPAYLSAYRGYARAIERAVRGASLGQSLPHQLT